MRAWISSDISTYMVMAVRIEKPHPWQLYITETLQAMNRGERGKMAGQPI
jgi:hypothetical protein